MFKLIVLLYLCLGLSTTSLLQAQRALLDKRQSTTCLDREFTVMAHILRDTFQAINTTPEEIAAGIDLLNAWFEPICVTFLLAQIDTIDNFQYDIPENINELEQIWTNHNAENRINLYLVTEVGFISPEPIYATFEGILQQNRGGILFNFQALTNTPLWLVHGFGHYCGLLDTNEDFGTEMVNGSNCTTTGDLICDTPADPLDPNTFDGGRNIYWNNECRFIFSGLDPNGEYYVPQTGNAMSRYPSYCWCGLTFEQFERMVTVIQRSGLW